jgi:hypothetical protein
MSTAGPPDLTERLMRASDADVECGSGVIPRLDFLEAARILGAGGAGV